MSWDPKLDDMLDELNKDDRIGSHVAVVDEVTEGEWPDGRKYKKVLVKLETARDSFADATLNEPEYLTKDQLAGLPSGQRRGVQLNLQVLKSLHQHYAITWSDLQQKLTFGTKLGCTTMGVKNKKTGKTYIRIAAFKPLAEVRADAAGVTSGTPTSDVPF